MRIVTALDLIKALNMYKKQRVHFTCTPIFELPPSISTLDNANKNTKFTDQNKDKLSMAVRKLTNRERDEQTRMQTEYILTCRQKYTDRKNVFYITKKNFFFQIFTKNIAFTIFA